MVGEISERHTLSLMLARLCVGLSTARTLHPPALRLKGCRVAACCLTGFKIQLAWQNLQTLVNACWHCISTHANIDDASQMH